MTSCDLSKIPARWWQWCPLLLGPAGMIISYLCSRTGVWDDSTKPFLERAAILITATAAVLALVRTLLTRERFHALLLALAITFLFREFHWEWTNRGVYIALAIIAGIAFAWRARLIPYVDRNPTVRTWLIATAVTYVLSQAIARRAFRGIMPNERAVYSDMEEIIENVSHVMLLVTVLVGPWVRTGSRRAVPSAETP